jgi:uncharacterized protein (TIGR00251 family)
MSAKRKLGGKDENSRAARSANVPAAKSSCTLAIKAIPNASRNEVAGWHGDALKVKVHAPPVDGRANEVLCDFLAATLGVPRRAVTVLHGETSRQKVVHIAGLTLADVKARLTA